MATETGKTGTMNGAQALVRALEDEGVEIIFGYPGAATIPIHDALMDSPIHHVLTRHEQGAAHAADGYARASGRVGVCLATSGPGALNLTTGIATAYMDSVPMVAITGQVATFKLGTDAFQEADMTGVSMPIVKHSHLIKHVSEIGPVIREAFHIASTGRPGPVVVDIPIDVSFAEVKYAGRAELPSRSISTATEDTSEAIAEAIEIINKAEKPLVCAGGGVIASGASVELTSFLECASIPVVYTLMGKGAFPDNHPLNQGMIGMHGCAYANYASRGCDLFIALGMRFSDRSTGKTSIFAPNAKVIHIDIDPAEIGKMLRPAVAISGDTKAALTALCESVKPAKHANWIAQLADWRRKHPLVQNGSDGRIVPTCVFDAINEITRGEAIVATDVGQHQMWSAQFLQVKHARGFLSSGGLGTMGFGLPAALGAQMAFPDKTVFVIAGDGSILMNNQEFMTAVEQRLPVKVVLFNNGYLGMVRQWQQIFYNRRYAATDISAQPDFVKLAEAYGAAGIRVTSVDEVKPALEAALAISDRPCLIDFHVTREANVLPMIPTGGGVDDMILELD